MAASQSLTVVPVLSVRLKADMEAVPDTSKSLVTETRPLIKVVSVRASFKVMELVSVTLNTSEPASFTMKSPVPPRLIM